MRRSGKVNIQIQMPSLDRRETSKLKFVHSICMLKQEIPHSKPNGRAKRTKKKFRSKIYYFEILLTKLIISGGNLKLLFACLI